MTTRPLQPMPQGLLNLSIEALWLAHVIHDALDIALDSRAVTQDLDPSRLHALRLSSDTFARLGDCGCTAEPVTPYSAAWAPASRLELIRQVAVQWRSLIDTAFGTTVSLTMIQTLSNAEVVLLQQIQNFVTQLPIRRASFLADMQQEYNAMAHRQAAQYALRRASYLKAAVGSVGAT